jgi:hypothetical protein
MTEMRAYLNRAVGLAAVAAFALATAAFGQCDLECPGGASLESEACGDDTNGGCNMDVPAFEPISIGETYCGTGWYDGSSRDTDWYEVEITTPGTYYWIGEAEYDVVLGFIEWFEGFEGEGDCYYITGYLNPYVATDACVQNHIEVEITVPGTYWFFVGAQFNDLVECDGFPEYIVTLSTEEPTGACCLPDDSCLDDLTYDECLQTYNGRYMGDGTLCDEVDCSTRPCPTYDNAIVLSHSLDQFTIVPGNGIACANTETGQTLNNYYARSYDLDTYPDIAGEDFYRITCVELGVETNSSSADVDAHCTIYRDTNGGDPVKAYIDLLPVASQDFVIPTGTSQEIFPIVFGNVVEFDLNDPDFPNVLVIEMYIEPSTEGEPGVWPGTNSAGQTGPTYFMSPDCGLNSYTTMANIGFPDCHWVSSVIGTTQAVMRSMIVDGEAWPPFDEQGNVQPVTDPEGDWKELYPNYDTTWTCTSWDDSNEDGIVSVCDYLNLETTGEEPSTWHVEWIGLTLWVKIAVGPDNFYVEFRGNLEGPDFPLGLYHEVWPFFCNDWLCTEWIDANGNSKFDVGDFLTYEVNQGEPEFYEILAMATDIELLESSAEEPCPWDLDGNGVVNTADLLILLGAWGTPGGDVNNDGTTNTADLLELLGHWGDCP